MAVRGQDNLTAGEPATGILYHLFRCVLAPGSSRCRW
uniref:Uncharacterized protein n=1 Tax=Anguilla anguilla TaxID=7936 RepID=A0A0E9SX00_ANGAN